MQKDCVMDNLHIWLVEIAAFNKKNSGQLYKEVDYAVFSYEATIQSQGWSNNTYGPLL